MTRRLALLAPLVIALGCGSKPEASPLRVAAASDLQTAMPVLISAFKAETGIEVEAVFGVSGQLAQQIRGGAPYDLFLAANRKFVADLAESGAVRPDSVRSYTKGTLVLIVNDLFDPGVKTLADVAGDRVKSIAIANPDLAPYGAAARQALERAGLWEKVKPKLVIGESVRHALQYVESGNAEVGFVGKAIAGVKGVRTIPLDPGAYDPIIQGLGIVAESKRAGDAEKFETFLLGATGQGILGDFGFQSIATAPNP